MLTRFRRAAAAVLLAVAFASPAGTQPDTSLTPIPAPTGFVVDAAGLLSEPARARLEAFLDQVQTKTGAQFAVLTVPTTAPESPSAYKVRVFDRWNIGRAGEDDGLLMLIAVDEREVRFETGYGLEGVLPDGLQSRIFRREMADHFRRGDWEQGINAGVIATAQRIAADKGVTLEWDGRELRYRPERPRTPGWLLALVVFVLVVMVLSNLGGPRGGRRRRRGGWYVGPGGWGGGWGGGFGGGLGGGGFGGGGFGGGFGGFGGGRSGGGGGGGSW
jgi:uncharacterized protein